MLELKNITKNIPGMVINHAGDVAFIIHYDFLSIHKKSTTYRLIY